MRDNDHRDLLLFLITHRVLSYYVFLMTCFKPTGLYPVYTLTVVDFITRVVESVSQTGEPDHPQYVADRSSPDRQYRWSELLANSLTPADIASFPIQRKLTCSHKNAACAHTPGACRSAEIVVAPAENNGQPAHRESEWSEFLPGDVKPALYC